RPHTREPLEERCGGRAYHECRDSSAPVRHICRATGAERLQRTVEMDQPGRRFARPVQRFRVPALLFTAAFFASAFFTVTFFFAAFLADAAFTLGGKLALNSSETRTHLASDAFVLTASTSTNRKPFMGL